MRRAALLVCAVLVGGGGSEKPPPPRDDAARVVEQLAAGLRDGELRTACRSLTLATRRVVAELGPPGAPCSRGLLPFLAVHGLRSSLADLTQATSRRSGARALVTGRPLTEPLPAVRNAGGWRVSLVGLPGVRQDVGAARACGTWFTRADARTLPPFTRGPLVRRLRSDVQRLDALRRELRGLTEGPPRPKLRELLDELGDVRAGLRTQGRRVAAGRDVAGGMQASVFADRFVREALGQLGSGARVACPRDVGNGRELPVRRAVLDRACSSLNRAADRLSPFPADRTQSLAQLRRFDAALGRLDVALARAPVPAGLRAVRRETRAATAAARRELARAARAGSEADFGAIADRAEGFGNQLDAGLVRLGASCLDPRPVAPRAAPRPSRPSPGPSPLPPSPAPRGGPPLTLS